LILDDKLCNYTNTNYAVLHDVTTSRHNIAFRNAFIGFRSAEIVYNNKHSIKYKLLVLKPGTWL